MYVSRNSKRQIMDDEIVRNFCEDCLGKKFVISTKKEQEKVEKNFSRVNILHFIGAVH